MYVILIYGYDSVSSEIPTPLYIRGPFASIKEVNAYAAENESHWKKDVRAYEYWDYEKLTK